MNSAMTPESLVKEAREIAEKATEGPWFVDKQYIKHRPRYVICVSQGLQAADIAAYDAWRQSKGEGL